MTKEEALRELSKHLMQCGALMPIEWVRQNGEGSRFMVAYQMAMTALKAGEEKHDF
jgi:hypothetical protein